MENKQLNFSAPLISARRYSSPQRSNYIEHNNNEKNEYVSNGSSSSILPAQQKLDLSLGDMVKPSTAGYVNVPFRWEKSPGKAKDHGSDQAHFQYRPGSPSTTPGLPPGRALDFVPWTSGRKLSGELKPIPAATAVRPQNRLSLSGEIKVLRPQNKVCSGELMVLRPPKKLSGEQTVVIPRPLNKFSGELNTSGRTKLSSSHISSSTGWGSSNPGGIGNHAKSDLETDDANAAAAAAYSDEEDTFSPLESCSISCSIMSGVSGSDCPGVQKLPGTTSSNNNVQARDFMMNRFLPAAKAMTLESPQYVSRRPMMAFEQPREVKGSVLPRAKEPTPARNDSKIVSPRRWHDSETEESEVEDEDTVPSAVSVKACRFLPWFCSKKSSLQFLNPVPAMKLGTKAALSSASKIGKLAKITPQKSIGQAPVKKSKTSSGIKAPDQLHHVDSKRNGKPRPMFYSGELQARGSLSPYRRSSTQTQGSISPYRNLSPQRLFHKGVGFLAVPKKVVNQPNDHEPKPRKDSPQKSEHQLLSRDRGRIGYEYGIPVAEKTLYIDSITTTTVRTSRSNSYSSRRESSGAKPSLHGDRWDIMKARGICRPPVSGVVDARIPPNTPDSTTKPDIDEDEHTDLNEQMIAKADDRCPPSPTPPLPKSPSDSWLLRNLNARSPSPRKSYTSSSQPPPSKAQLKQQDKDVTVPPPTSGGKWETILKRSHAKGDHGYSEELVAHAPNTRK